MKLSYEQVVSLFGLLHENLEENLQLIRENQMLKEQITVLKSRIDDIEMADCNRGD